MKVSIHHRVSYVLKERLCQHYLENYFAPQRSMGAGKDNLAYYNTVYNDNTIQSQKIFKPVITGKSIQNQFPAGNNQSYTISLMQFRDTDETTQKLF